MTGRAGGAVAQRTLVRLSGIGKSYPGVRAVDGIDLDFREGEIHSIVGENGAGKSTLVRLLAGLELPTDGEISIDGAPARLKSPRAARDAGVSLVPQEAALVPNLSIGRNVLLGRQRWWTRRVTLTEAEREEIARAVERVGLEDLPFDAPAAGIPAAQLRLLQIAATLIDPGRLLILDEPTAVLSDADAEKLLGRLEQLRAAGTSILYISHRLGEVMRLSDRVSILRDGRLVGTYERGELDREAMLRLMARKQGPGRNGSSSLEVREPAPSTGKVLEVKGLSSPGAFDTVDVMVRPGEVVGIAGIQGSGHGRFVDVVAGARPASSGELFVDGEAVPLSSPRAALRAGVRVVPEERRERGIVGPRSIRENLAVGHGVPAQSRLVRRVSQEIAATQAAIEELDIFASSGEVAAATLSGGNQQKVVIARALASSPRVLMLSEPTQGIDVRAKTEILGILRRTAREQGIGIVLASCEFEELLDFTDRIYVMRLGRIVAELDTALTSYADILKVAVP